MIIEKIQSSKDNLILEMAISGPQITPIGIVQLVHGMSEHKERYFKFMDYLSARGYVCVIHDHRGHGASVKDSSHLGYFYTEDISFIVDDAFQVTEYIKAKYTKLGISIFSHSMGTLVARNYLKKYDDQIDKIILCGPPTKNGLVNIALTLATITKTLYGKYDPNKFLDKLSLRAYNKGCDVKNGWISSDVETVDEYNRDGLCGFTFTTNGFINLYKLLKEAFIKQDWDVKNPSLPIFLIAGADDPVIQSEKKFYELKDFLNGLGYKNILSKLYKHKRHELLNEIGLKDIYKDILDFLVS